MTKELDDITGALREWGVCVPPYIVSSSNFFMAIGVALTLPIQHEFLQILEDRVVQNSTSFFYTLFLLLPTNFSKMCQMALWA